MQVTKRPTHARPGMHMQRCGGSSNLIGQGQTAMLHLVTCQLCHTFRPVVSFCLHDRVLSTATRYSWYSTGKAHSW